MKRALVIASLLIAGTAWGGAPLITPPAGWRLDAEQSNAAAAKANGVSHFGGTKSISTANVYVPNESGVALFVTAVAATSSTDRALAARAEVDDFHAASQRAAHAGDTVNESWAESVDSTRKVIHAELTWIDTPMMGGVKSGATTKTIANLVIAADGEHLVAVTGECIAAYAAPQKLIDACEAALATLDPGIPVDKRVDAVLAPAGTPPPPPPDREAGSNTLSTMTDGSRAVLPPMTVPTEKPAPDRRPVYVGLGIVLLAAAFWWNQRRRAKFEKDSDE